MEASQQASNAGIFGLPSLDGCESTWSLVPEAASLRPCARRASGRRLCPSVPAPGADTFPLGCVTTAPTISRAPCVLSVSHFALSLLRSMADVGAGVETMLQGLRTLADTGAEARSTLQSLRATARNTGCPQAKKDTHRLSAPTKQEEPHLHMTAQPEPDLQCSKKHLHAVSPRSAVRDASFLATSRHTWHDVTIEGAGHALADVGLEMPGTTINVGSIAARDTAISPKQPCGDRPPTPRKSTRVSEVCTTTARANGTKSTTLHLVRGSTHSKPQLPLRQRPLHSPLSRTKDLGPSLLSMVQHRSRMLSKMPSTVRSLSLDSQCPFNRGSQSSNVDSVTSAMVLDLRCGAAAEVAATKSCTTSFALKDGLNFKRSTVLHRHKQGWLPQIQSAREVADPAWRSSLETSLRPRRSRLRSVY